MEREILIEVRDYSSETFEGFVLDRFNRLTQQPDLVPFSLSGTGFSILDQMRVYGELRDAVLMGEIGEDTAKEKFVEKTTEDMAAFYLEYLKRIPVLPIKIGFRENSGEREVICPKYDSALLSEIVSWEEREGKTKEAVISASDQLVQAEGQTMVVFTSPIGWSGFAQPYTETQTYAYLVDEMGSLSGMTVRSSMTLAENEEMLRLLGGAGFVIDGLSEKERIKKVAGEVVVCENASIDDLLEVIGKVRGRTLPVFDDQSTGQRYYLDEIKEAVERRDEFFRIDGQIESIMEEFEKYVWERVDFLSSLDENQVQDLMIEMGRVVLTMSFVLQGKETGAVGEEGDYSEYQRAYSFVQSMGGCNGGGEESGGKNSSAGGEKFVRKCGMCGYVLFRMIRAGFRCPSCGGVYRGC
ncbi:hypothetical protein A2382_00305 [Candidatus Woesebacteria bacterium RIFOXYB1_FULL_38_16]|uniref:Uncharacterized protein n=1 Tax=Candidatus Woesebacteria bacterium RIFOXYB1_FULL_38_16 TaxID=1802538 RepID=A0A1F8CS88_9BACT|nr:MAG: hypothetical protein A2191_01170 [Candidatus Woesebacteria bacterium RIFOXYA1_FULL_38_9]OGM79213.1 MAG: hypothetical protein A2382_00305 [Candidatus Woesebacteria bacterium RIFOXYB1_FULL_38_16]